MPLVNDSSFNDFRNLFYTLALKFTIHRFCSSNFLGASPFDSFQVADVGDVSFNLYNLPKACEDIRRHYQRLISDGCIPLTLGGDHTISYPILQAMKVSESM